MSDPRSDTRPFTVTKTDQFNAVDTEGDIQFTITGWEVDPRAKTQGAVTLHTDHPSGKHFRPGKAAMRCMGSEEGWGSPYASDWVGKTVRIFADPDVRDFKGNRVGGLRIRAMSHIRRPFDFRSRTSRQSHTMYKIGTIQAEQPAANNINAQRQEAVKHWTSQGVPADALCRLVRADVGAWGPDELATLLEWHNRIRSGEATIASMVAASGRGEE